jgi:hypothetical protein
VVEPPGDTVRLLRAAVMVKSGGAAMASARGIEWLIVPETPVMATE